MKKFNSPKNVRSYLKSLDVKTIKKYSTNTTLGYCVLTLSICGNLNVGTIMRTAQLMGADTYIVFGKRSFDRRSAVGAMNYMNVERVFGVKDSSTELKKDLTPLERMICPDKFYNYMITNNFVPVFLEQRHDAVYDDNVNWNSRERKLKKGWKLCFVFGNEGDGIANDVVTKGLTIPNSFIICIRQLGALQSLNVSASVAIILSQYKNYKMKKRLERYDLITC
jgi:tRNA G18 (ribose-2'-O)-methylase SpoU